MKRSFLPVLFFLAGVLLYSQENQAQGLSPYLLPQTVYVGDRARLVVPLGQNFSSAAAFVSNSPENLFRGDLPRGGKIMAADVIISRVELEQRGGNPRLLIDFVPYVTGVIHFPAIMVQGDVPLEVSGLRITVASILEPYEASLSGLAAPLAAPGTGFIIYGALVLVLAFLFLCIGGGIWYKNHFAYFKMRLKRRRLLKAMDRLLKRLKSESISADSSGADGQKNENPGAESLGVENREELFSILSHEFREFISLFTGIDCRALTPGEFGSLDIPASETVSREFLVKLFSRWETIRFGGSKISSGDFFAVLDEVSFFISTLEEAERSIKITGDSPEAEGEAQDETSGEPVNGAYA